MAPPKKIKDTKPRRKQTEKTPAAADVVSATVSQTAMEPAAAKPKTARRLGKAAAGKPETALQKPPSETKRRLKSAANGKPPLAAKKTGRPRSKTFVPHDLLDDHIVSDDEEDVIAEPDELDPLGIPIELLAPELREAAKSAALAKPKPKQPKAERRLSQCTYCGGTFNWLSVEKLCFACVKKKLAQRKRDDESYSGFSEPADDDDDHS